MATHVSPSWDTEKQDFSLNVAPVVAELQRRYNDDADKGLADLLSFTDYLHSLDSGASYLAKFTALGDLIGNALAQQIFLVGRNLVVGTDGDDTLTGTNGEDVLVGSDGNDVYRFNADDGQDSLVDRQIDDSLLLEGIGKADIWFSRAGNDLLLTLLDSQDSITIDNWYWGSGNQIETLSTGATSIDHEDVETLVAAMSGYEVPAHWGGLSQGARE